MVRGRCATLVVYVCVFLINPIWSLLTVPRLRKVDPEDGPQDLCFKQLLKYATEASDDAIGINRGAI